MQAWMQNAKRKLKKTSNSTAFFEAVDYLVIYKCRPCWPFQLYRLNKYGHTPYSVVGKMSVRPGRRPGYTLANIATEMSEARQLDDYETSWTWPRLLHTPILECWRGPNKTPVSWLPTWHAGLLVVQMWAFLGLLAESQTRQKLWKPRQCEKVVTSWR